MPAGERPKPTFRDYSRQGADYAPLADLRLHVDSVSYVGPEPILFDALQVPARRYDVTASVKVQTLCAIGAVNTELYEWAPARFKFLVGEEQDRRIHDAYVREVYEAWR